MNNDTRDSGGRGDAPPEVHFEEEEIDLSGLSWVDAPGILVFWVLAVVVFLQFFTRYVLNDSLASTEEVARYLRILVASWGPSPPSDAACTSCWNSRSAPCRLAGARCSRSSPRR